jgi:hypothetical protein
MKDKNCQRRQTIEDLKRQNAAFELQSNESRLMTLDGYLCLLLVAHLLERVKQTGHYTRQLVSSDISIKIEPDLISTIPATQNLLADDNHRSIVS